MPPKKSSNQPSKKTEQKKKEKVIEDKTFGLKNKKGAKQQKYIKTVTNQVKHGQTGGKQIPFGDEKKSKKDDKKKELQELNELFKPVVVAQKISKGADPKSVVCAFFKQGQCTKGDKCKFSHDMSLERKSEKRSIYVDARDEDLEKDTMDNWDVKKLEEVVQKKHGEAEQKKTSIVCKHFLEAIENNKYGWFWICPGGGDSCMYRHALPPGFVLKKNQKKEIQEEISLEDLIETERAALGPEVTRITLETFLEWKKRKRLEKIEKSQQDLEKRKADFNAGKAFGVSGREVFEFRPELISADDDEADDTQYSQEQNEEVEEAAQISDIDVSRFVPIEIEKTGITVSTGFDRKGETHSASLPKEMSNDADENKLDEASGGVDNGKDGKLDGELADAHIDGVPVDENLFTGEDLDELDDELDNLDLED
ncbi:zinc finger CCCH domain-containing protein 15 [Hypanus sabinus]|uniref:zinc finger CCCH domain-containing protein 15 n=1 Tax=Hypanus sabinus TaxID=79690 RepID=UPI0028C3A18E|nr:zinc finger CCCH domain-containing protein 15 [Hypanus sabinus]